MCSRKHLASPQNCGADVQWNVWYGSQSKWRMSNMAPIANCWLYAGGISHLFQRLHECDMCSLFADAEYCHAD